MMVELKLRVQVENEDVLHELIENVLSGASLAASDESSQWPRVEVIKPEGFKWESHETWLDRVLKETRQMMKRNKALG